MDLISVDALHVTEHFRLSSVISGVDWMSFLFFLVNQCRISVKLTIQFGSIWQQETIQRESQVFEGKMYY